VRGTFKSLKIIVIKIIYGKSSGIVLGAYAYGKKDSLVEEPPIYWELSRDERNRRRRYREFVKGMMRSKEAMRGEMERRVIYDSELFAGKLKKAYKMEEMIKPTGRPKKEPK
jgi:hypothetical protein